MQLTIEEKRRKAIEKELEENPAEGSGRDSRCGREGAKERHTSETAERARAQTHSPDVHCRDPRQLR